MVHATSEANGRHAETPRKSQTHPLNAETDHKNDCVVRVQPAVEDRGIEDNLDAGAHSAEITSTEGHTLDGKSGAIAPNTGSPIQQHDIEKREQALDPQKVTPEEPTSDSHNILHGEQAIGDHIVQPQGSTSDNQNVGHGKEAIDGPTSNNNIVGTEEISTKDHDVQIQKPTHGDSVDTSSITVSLICNLSDPLFGSSISQMMDLAHSPSRLRVSVKDTMGWSDDTGGYHSTQNTTTQDDETKNIISLDDQNAIIAIYNHLAELLPEVSYAFKEYRTNCLWDYVRKQPHPLEHYRPSRSLAPYGAVEEDRSPDSPFWIPKKFQIPNDLQSKFFQYLLCRKLGLLRPHSPELSSILAPCGLFWYQQHTHSLKMKLKKQSFDNIWSRWYCISETRYNIRRYQRSPYWHGTMIPTQFLLTIDQFFITNWGFRDNSKWPLDSITMYEKLRKYLQSDPAEIISLVRTRTEAESQLFDQFISSMKRDHGISFNVYHNPTTTPGDLILATARLFSHLAHKCQEPYGTCKAPYGKNNDRWMFFRPSTFLTLCVDPNGRFKERKAKKDKKPSLKARAKIREQRIKFIQRDVPHQIKAERPEIARDDPNCWTVAEST